MHHMIISHTSLSESTIYDMNHATFVMNLLAVWLMLQTSAIMIANKWDIDELNKQLHDPAKERIDLDCHACLILVDAIQFLARETLPKTQ